MRTIHAFETALYNLLINALHMLKYIQENDISNDISEVIINGTGHGEFSAR